MTENSTGTGGNTHEQEQERIIDDLKKTCLNNEQFLDLLMNKVADRAFDKMEKQDSTRRSRQTKNSAIAAALAVPLLLGIGATVYESLKQTIISDAIRKAQSSAEKETEKAIRYNVERIVNEEIDKEISLANDQINRSGQRWEILNTILQLNNLAGKIEKREVLMKKKQIDHLSWLTNLKILQTIKKLKSFRKF